MATGKEISEHNEHDSISSEDGKIAESERKKTKQRNLVKERGEEWSQGIQLIQLDHLVCIYCGLKY